MRPVILIKAGIKRTKLMPQAFMFAINQQTVFNNTGRKIQFSGAKRTNLDVVLQSQQNINVGRWPVMFRGQLGVKSAK